MQFSLRMALVAVSLTCAWLALVAQGQFIIATILPAVMGSWLLSKDRTTLAWLGLFILYGGMMVKFIAALIAR